VAAERYGSTAVSLSVVNEAASLPIDYRLYLPKDWAGDRARRADAALFAGDGGADMKFQAGLLALELDYVVGVQPNSSVWQGGKGPLSAKELALSLPASAWLDVTWRAGSRGDLASRFAVHLFVQPIETTNVKSPGPNSGSSSSGPTTKPNPANSGSPTSLPTRPSMTLSGKQNHAGGSNATISNSSRPYARERWPGSVIMKAAAGVDSITMPAYASPPMAPWSPND